MAIGILCSGGDSCGMNPALKSFVDYAYSKNETPYFIYEGFEGLIENKIQKAEHKDVAGILHLGGTIIKTSRSQRFFETKYRQQAYENLLKHDIDKLIVLGGDGSFKGLHTFSQEFPISFIGIPTTIDNDIYGTNYSLGVDTALNVIKDALDDIRDTSSSFKRAFVVETMGRDSGYLAAVSAITSGAEICIIPESSFNLKTIKQRLQKELKEGREYILAIVAEGTKKTKEIAKFLEKNIGIETRVIVLGHIQRGGNPTVFERRMAHAFIIASMDKLLDTKHTQSICVYTQEQFQFISTQEVISKTKTLDEKLLLQIHSMTK